MKLKVKRPDDFNEAQLLASVKKDDSLEASTSLFSYYSDLVYGTCLKYLKDAVLAEDAVMNIYQEFVVKIKKHEVSNLKGWLYVLSKNHCLGVLRKTKREVEKFDQFSLVYSDELLHPNDREHTEMLERKLIGCIETLNEMQKKCVQLFYYEKESYQEISEKLEIPWNKIRSYIQNGRRNLKKCIESK